MEEVLKANIFFFITSIAVVLVTLFVLVILYYLYCTVKNIKELSDTVKASAEDLVRNMANDGLHRHVRRFGGSVLKVFGYALGAYMREKVSEKHREKRRQKQSRYEQSKYDE
ncbi:MAG TPA: hypothetical protein VFM02_00255 [Candidatus Paceibacterota bacterium]|nr:hypothetical protein [Candidatus Paceibacterota bacterium]